MRQIAAAVVGVGLALGALGLDDHPLLAWSCAVALTVLAIVASLALIASGRHDLTLPGAGLAATAMLSGVFAPSMAPPSLARGVVGIIACISFLFAFVLWTESVERPIG